MFIVVFVIDCVLLFLNSKKECSYKGMNREKEKVEIKEKSS
jgi:hypothetical protein